MREKIMVSSSLVKTDRILSKERRSSPDIKFKEGIVQVVDKRARGREMPNKAGFTKTEMTSSRVKVISVCNAT
jgi:hypothetical protein